MVNSFKSQELHLIWKHNAHWFPYITRSDQLCVHFLLTLLNVENNQL